MSRTDEPAGDPARRELLARWARLIEHAGAPAERLAGITAELGRLLPARDVELVVGLLAVALEDSRRVDQERRLAVLEERQRLARDLHDSVSQLLFSSTLLAESIPDIYRRSPADGAQRLERLVELNRKALGEMRALLRELTPAGGGADFSSRELPPPAVAVLHRRGLVEALRGELATLETQGLHTRLEASSYERQSREREEMLLKVAQEALANVVKHAGATEVRVRLASLAEEVRLTVRDNGRGFDARRSVRETDRREGGLGLASMRDRIRAMSGRLVVESAPGLGTTVEAGLPR